MAITIYCMVVHFSRDAWKGYNYWAVLALVSPRFGFSLYPWEHFLTGYVGAAAPEAAAHKI